MVGLGQPQPFPNEFDFRLRSGNTFFRFLLKGVNDIDNVGKFHRVNSPVSASLMILRDFKNPGSMKAFQRSGRLDVCPQSERSTTRIRFLDARCLETEANPFCYLLPSAVVS